MNNAWSDFLQSRTVTQSVDEPPCALNDLSHFGLIRVTGEDAETFLQGQLTNDMREVTEERSQLAGWCSPKGRMLANFRCFRRGQAYYLQTPAENLALVTQRLGMFVLRSQVSLADASDELMRIGLTGECVEPVLAPLFDTLPCLDNEVKHQGELSLIRLPGAVCRYELLGPAEALMEVWRIAEPRATYMGDDFWALQDIRAGLPTIYPATREAFVPQMTNMQLVDGVSFTKGCYVGQEVVARMQHLGTLKRRMYLAHVTADAPPQPGDDLYSQVSTSGQGTGKVVDARPSNDGYDLLAVIETKSAEAGEVCLGEKGPPLRMQHLPYPFPDC